MHKLVFPILGLIVLEFLVMAAPLAAQRDAPVGIQRPKVIENWLERLKKAEERLEAGAWKKAKRDTEDVLTEMCDRIEGGQAVADLLGMASLLRSLAEAGLGNESAANWDYITAQTLTPRFSKLNLDRFGEAGKLLHQWRLEEDSDAEGSGDSEEKASATEAAAEKQLTRPKKIRAPYPKYPFGKYQACIDGPIVVKVIIDEEGHPTHPQLMTEQDPLLGFAATEALRDWRFKPARLDGEPISVYYQLTVNFKLPICGNAHARMKKKRDET